MYLCYMDESGDPGTVGSPTEAYAVSAALVKDTAWSSTLDDLIRFRRWVKNSFGVPMRAEVKANELVQGKGPWTGIGDKRRKDIFRQWISFASDQVYGELRPLHGIAGHLLLLHPSSMRERLEGVKHRLRHYPQTASLDEAVGGAILLVRVSAPHHALFEESLNGLGRVDRPF